MEDLGTAETSAAFKDTRNQKLDIREEETKCKDTVIEHKKAIEDKYLKCTSSSYGIMTINMNGKNQGKGTTNNRKELIISTIKRFPTSVIFCQELPGNFETEVVAECGNDSYKFVPEQVRAGDHAVVMWRETDFKWKEVRRTSSSITKIRDDLRDRRSDLEVSQLSARTAMVKLTSHSTGASFLAVSWHGPAKESLETKQKTFNGLIRFLYEVCKKEKLSSFIIGGDFNLNTSVDLEEHKRVTISRYELCTRDKEKVQHKTAYGRRFMPYKDTFIVSVTAPSDKRPLTGDITVSSAMPFDLVDESIKNTLLDHVPVVGVLKLPRQFRGKLEQHCQSCTFRPTFVITVCQQSCHNAQIYNRKG